MADSRYSQSEMADSRHTIKVTRTVKAHYFGDCAGEDGISFLPVVFDEPNQMLSVPKASFKWKLHNGTKMVRPMGPVSLGFVDYTQTPPQLIEYPESKWNSGTPYGIPLWILADIQHLVWMVRHEGKRISSGITLKSELMGALNPFAKSEGEMAIELGAYVVALTASPLIPSREWITSPVHVVFKGFR